MLVCDGGMATPPRDSDKPSCPQVTSAVELPARVRPLVLYGDIAKGMGLARYSQVTSPLDIQDLPTPSYSSLLEHELLMTLKEVLCWSKGCLQQRLKAMQPPMGICGRGIAGRPAGSADTIQGLGFSSVSLQSADYCHHVGGHSSLSTASANKCSCAPARCPDGQSNQLPQMLMHIALQSNPPSPFPEIQGPTQMFLWGIACLCTEIIVFRLRPWMHLCGVALCSGIGCFKTIPAPSQICLRPPFLACISTPVKIRQRLEGTCRDHVHPPA